MNKWTELAKHYDKAIDMLIEFNLKENDSTCIMAYDEDFRVSEDDCENNKCEECWKKYIKWKVKGENEL